MSSNDKALASAQARPYYNRETFNIGYPAVFNPDRGVLDQNGASIASKLSIANQKRSRFASSPSSSGAIDRLIPLGGISASVGGKYGTQLYFPGISLSWKDMCSIGRWENLIWKVLLRQYCKNLIQQPFETCKIIMQTTSINRTISYPDNKSVNKKVAVNGINDKDSNVSLPTNEEIDFFPVQNQSSDAMDLSSAWANDDDANNNLNKQEDDLLIKDPKITENMLNIDKLTTWNVIHSMRNNKNFGIGSLWRSNNITFFYNFCKTGVMWFTARFISPFYYYYNLSFSSILGLKILMNFMTEVILLPLDLYKVKSIISNHSTRESDFKSNDATKENKTLNNDQDMDNSVLSTWMMKLKLKNYWSFTMDDRTLRLFALILIKTACKKFFDNGLEFMIYYWLNFTNVENKIYLIFLLKFVTEFCEFFIKLPVETLLRRYQVDYLLGNGNDSNNDGNSITLKKENLIIKPINVNTSEIWQGLWNGWKIGLMSLVCGFGFKLMNNIDDDLEQERF
ncbi:similar to Saccharomyces cerevisiae YDR470C UGO1 Outer membrane component of the mitochondrial fusion machinery [Maudiozyma saulgeensis]|uniref:Similar to Saccharomyces cerevisiae YDR470C UGO1 Outer membrane component of the mitochondrial fusion machinery n=1 Tax=Maudiozyma saulgeensis TaxID=1789683 RepID=A0A1X7R9H6_9SACH|nr:similar to Saccharomyces cerevisiae YDR470C UGO1 Outer membrane component of the mitochondrial fusion machinery [Kazachstania saulgeensis]